MAYVPSPTSLSLTNVPVVMQTSSWTSGRIRTVVLGRRMRIRSFSVSYRPQQQQQSSPQYAGMAHGRTKRTATGHHPAETLDL